MSDALSKEAIEHFVAMLDGYATIDGGVMQEQMRATGLAIIADRERLLAERQPIESKRKVAVIAGDTKMLELANELKNRMKAALEAVDFSNGRLHDCPSCPK